MKRGSFWMACCLIVAAPGCRRARPPVPVSEVRLATPAHPDRILRGIYPGEGGWRWTAPRFAVALDPPAGQPAWFDMDFTLPEELLARAPDATVVAKAGGVEIARETYRKPGRYTLTREAAAVPQTAKRVEIEISVDRSFTDGGASREQGLIVFSVALAPYEGTAAFRESEAARSREAYADVIRQRDLALSPEKQRELMKVFHELPIWNSLWYQNIRVIKNPLDLWMLQQIAWEVRPDFVVETGTWQGGSALWWAHALEAMRLDGARVVTVDIQDLTAAAAAHPIWKDRVEFLLGDSADPRLVARIAAKVKGGRVLVNLDSDHSMEHVLKELRLYAPLVSRGSYIAVEDTHLDGVPTHPEDGPGPMAAVRRFLTEGGARDFEQDFTREAMVMTSYPGGWLRRK